MPRENFRTALDELRAAVLDMGDLVLERLQQALRAFLDGDEELARQVRDSDAAVNERYFELEARCIDLFALEQPVASDLRLVAGSFKILTDLERIGDLAANLAEYALASTAAVDTSQVAAIGELAIQMVEDALAAYENRDPAACVGIADRDDELDDRCERASTVLIESLIAEAQRVDREALLDAAETVLLAIRDLERVGDHAVNVAGRTQYVLEGDPELIH
jgi:phosphate transport system protein